MAAAAVVVAFSGGNEACHHEGRKVIVEWVVLSLDDVVNADND